MHTHTRVQICLFRYTCQNTLVHTDMHALARTHVPTQTCCAKLRPVSQVKVGVVDCRVSNNSPNCKWLGENLHTHTAQGLAGAAIEAITVSDSGSDRIECVRPNLATWPATHPQLYLCHGHPLPSGLSRHRHNTLIYTQSCYTPELLRIERQTRHRDELGTTTKLHVICFKDFIIRTRCMYGCMDICL